MTPKATKTLEMTSQLEAVSRSMALIEFSLDGKSVFANENFISTMGYSNNELVGQHHKILCEKEYAASHEYHIFWQKLNRGEYVSGKVLRVSHRVKKYSCKQLTIQYLTIKVGCIRSLNSPLMYLSQLMPLSTLTI